MTRAATQALGLLLLAAAVAFAPPAARAQAPPRIGYLGLSSTGEAPALEAFRDELKRLGHVEGQNVVVDYRWAEGRNERFPALAAELAGRRPAVIVSPCGPALRAIRQASRTVPVVAQCIDERNFLGEVASLARPGGNTTGFTYLAPEAAGKRLQLLKEVAPAVTRVAVIQNPENDWSTYWSEMRSVAQRFGIALQPVDLRRIEEFPAAGRAIQ